MWFRFQYDDLGLPRERLTRKQYTWSNLNHNSWNVFQVLTGILDEDVCAQACQDFLLCSNYTFFGPSNPLKWVKLYRTEGCPTWKMGIYFSFLMKTKRSEAWIFPQVRLFPLLLLQRRLNWLRRLSCWSPTVPGDCWSGQDCWQTRGWLFKVVFMVNRVKEA